MLEINSAQNPRVKRIAKLRTARGRRRQDRILIEGGREVLRALENGFMPEEVFFVPALLEDQQTKTDAARCLALLRTEAKGDGGDETQEAQQSPLLIGVAPSVWRKLAVRGDDVQILAVGKRPERELADLRLPEMPLLLVLEAVEKPGNVGAMFRAADGAGVDAILLAQPQCDWLNPNAIRASLGAVFSVPAVAASNEAIGQFLTERGIQPLAAVVDAEQDFWSADCTAAIAIVVGSEANGLSPFWQESAQSVRLPMCGAVDSLNVASTAAIMLYETVRQRSQS